mmetsp:Transcript_6479/g.13292  ORF Transcript_6479/g.13292 Transcript_6479/m.13292 type:complete len:159 (+) Transcript_6479:448-924(+)
MPHTTEQPMFVSDCVSIHRKLTKSRDKPTRVIMHLCQHSHHQIIHPESYGMIDRCPQHFWGQPIEKCPDSFVFIQLNCHINSTGVIGTSFGILHQRFYDIDWVNWNPAGTSTNSSEDQWSNASQIFRHGCLHQNPINHKIYSIARNFSHQSRSQTSGK